MNKILAIFAFVVAMPLSSPAHAFIKCDKMSDAKKAKKCNKNTSKSLAKSRKSTTAVKPSSLGSAFSYLDAANPLDTDDWYIGESKIGVKAVDDLTAQINQIAATVQLAAYAGHLNQTDKAAASKLGGALLPELIKLKDEAPKVVEKAQALMGDPAALVKDNPAAALKIPKALAGGVKNIVAAVKALPGATKAIGPIAKGAAGAAAAGAMDKVSGAVDKAKDAADTAKDAAGAAKDAADAVKK
jgi:methyl-accepting chemotaxis protein